MVNRILAAMVFATVVGCSGGGNSSDPHGGDAKASYPEIFVYNDYYRFRRLGADTEKDTAERMNTVGTIFSSSAVFANNLLQPLLVGQHTAVTPHETLAITVHAGGTVDYAEYLLGIASWRASYLSGSPGTESAAVILLTELDDVHGRESLAFTGQMCNPNAAVGVVRTGRGLAFDSASLARAIGGLAGMCDDPPGNRSSISCPTLPAGMAETCRGGIMEPSSAPNDPPKHFSACSAWDLDDWMAFKRPDGCLTVPPLR